MISPKEYKQAKENIKKISKKEDIQEKIFEKEENKIYHKFNKLEDDLKEKRGKEEDIIEKKKEKFKEEISKEEEPFCKQISEFNRIISFMNIIKNNNKTLNFKVYYYGYPKDEKGEIKRILKDNCWCYPEEEKIPYKEIATIKNDEYALIKVFIVTNKKPKNSDSLIIVGRTIFNKDVLKEMYSYGLGCETEGNNISKSLKDMPTEEELVIYFEKNKSNILKEYLEEHKKVEQEYREVIELTKNKEWELAYWEDKKDYYENHYNRGTEQPEYKEVLKEIKKIKCDFK